MKTFRIHWLGSGGRTEVVIGHDIADACNRAGIGNGALPAMDFYDELAFLAVHAPSSDECKVHMLTTDAYRNNVPIVGKISARQLSKMRIEVASPTQIGITLDIDGAAKTFINGDQIVRTYKAFNLEQQARAWLASSVIPVG